MTARREEYCTLLQEIGLPAVRIKATGEVIEFNELFSSLTNGAAPLDYRLWFRQLVLPGMTPADRSCLEAAFAHGTSARVHVAFNSVDGRALDFEMRAFPLLGQKKLDRTILCVFIPLTTPIFEGVYERHISEGRELERCRIRNELHKGVSQTLLGAAFGCKLLAGKVATLSESLGKEASDLAELVNEAVVELQNLVHSSEDHS